MLSWKENIMIDQDVLIEKINLIQDCLARIHTKTASDIESLNDIDIREIVVFNLQRAIQLTIDLAFHIVTAEKFGIPKNLKDGFQLLSQHKIIDRDIADRLSKMVGFRNIVVHEYEDINLDIVKSIVKNNLSDIEVFYSIVIKRYSK